MRTRSGVSSIPAGAVLAVGAALALSARPAASDPVQGAIGEDQKIVHALNRLAFGPRPGDVAAVRQMGLGRWMDLQLHPERIDDSPVRAKFAVFQRIQKSPQDLMAMYQEDQQARRQAQQARKAAAKEQAPGQAPAPPAMMAMRQVPETAQAIGELDDAKILLAAE